MEERKPKKILDGRIKDNQAKTELDRRVKEKPKKGEKLKFNKLKFNKCVIAFVVLFLLLIGSVFTNGFGLKDLVLGESSDKIAKAAIDYINENLLANEMTASLVESSKEKNGLYRVKFKIGEQEFDSYVSGDGKILFPQGISMEAKQENNQKQTENQNQAKTEKSTIGNFKEADEETCKEDGKPIIYFFSSVKCPHCNWEHPIIEEVVASFKENIIFHDNTDSNEDSEILKKYSTGGIPTIVLGCKYYRVGSGESMGKEEEKKVLTELICNLTNNQPSEICEKN